MKHAALYVRVSTEEQKKQGLSVDNQIDALVNFCKENKMKYKIYNDAGISGHKAYKKRPALLNLINDCQQGNVSLILFTRLDRWFRSVKDYYLVLDQLNGVPWRAIWEDYETETSSGQLKVNIMLSVAEAEASRTSEKIKSVLAYKRELGEHIGQIPYGFKIENKILVVDEETKEDCQRMFDVYFKTGSITAVRKAMKGTSAECTESSMYRRFKSKYYVGPYITEEQHEFILAQMKKHLIPCHNKHIHLFMSLMRCPTCGLALCQGDSNQTRKDGRRVTYLSYRCKNGCFNMSEKQIEKQMIDYLDKVIGETDLRAEIVQIEDRKKGSAEIDKKISRLKDLYIDGDLTKEEYTRKKEALEEKKAEINQKKPSVLPTLPDNWKEVYAELTKEGKRTFWQRILNHIDVSDKAHLVPYFN